MSSLTELMEIARLGPEHREEIELLIEIATEKRRRRRRARLRRMTTMYHARKRGWRT